MDSLEHGSQDNSSAIRTVFSRKELYLILKNENFVLSWTTKCAERLVVYVLNKLNCLNCEVLYKTKLKSALKVFVTKLNKKWKECYRFHDKLICINEDWLSAEFVIPQINPESTTNKTPGRPKKSFSTTSVRSKQRHVKTVVSQIPSEVLNFAASTSMVQLGKRKAAKVMQLAVESSPKTVKRMEAATTPNKSFTSYSPLEALALMVDTGMTKEDYIKVQRGAKSRGANIYPSYSAIAQAKKTCYPDGVTFSECEARIPLQQLLDHTVQRLFEVQKEVMLLYLPEDVLVVDVYYKWGLDGSGGHSIYKQSFTDNPKYSDASIILSTIVPLEVSIIHDGQKKIFWKNPSSSSTKWCRPIAFKLVKESTETTRQEYSNIQNQIEAVSPTKVNLCGKSIDVHHIPICTMIDGKTCNVLTETSSSQACNICHVTPKAINNIEDVLQRPCDISAYKFGLSVLHSYLRSFEFLLHIAYKMETKQWQARGIEAKEAVKKKKQEIADLFYEKMGLVVDQPKHGGGNTNDGNTARKFFDNPDTAAEITKIDKQLIERFANILKTISSCHYIDLSKFRPYCLETAKRCIQLYSWYKMSASVHKLLIHGSDIIQALPLPVGQLSEDVLESSQKEFKNIRLMHSRKTSRENTNIDILHWLCINSDPIISDYRWIGKNNKKALNDEVLNMITMPPYFQTNPDVQNEEQEEDSDDVDSE